MEDGRIQGWICDFIDHILIHEQLGKSIKKTVDVANATFEEAKTTSKKIASPHAFTENEQWSVVCKKEEFHARFVVKL
jgi:hypothetical protein